ncbi:MAG: DUF1538 domain-containing protein [Clostridia bacterium]|nr:DUF1538 domain-containing protein [Clostridia bacterium]
MNNKTILREKLRESVLSVLPIAVIIMALCFTVAPVSTDLMLSFFIGTALLIVGMALFSLGAETSMTPIGNRVGAAMTKSRSLMLIVLISFAMGFAVTVAEPDLQVLANNVPHIHNLVLILTVSIGVGLFLVVSMLRIVFGVSLRWLLLIFYAGMFALAFFSERDFIAVAFDSGGVTTGPMTVPFIMALGVGVARIRSDSNAETDSFGLVALCSIGPVLAVLLLGFIYKGDSSAAQTVTAAYRDTVELGHSYLAALPAYLREMGVALAPIIAILAMFQMLVFKMSRHSFFRMCVGVLYTYIGLVLFLTGVNVGFSPLGGVLGGELATGGTKYVLVPLSMLMGWFIISAEPAVIVLEKQVEEITSGAIAGRTIKRSLSVAIAAAMGLAMLRVITGLSIMWVLVPGYALALALAFLVPPIFTSIAFDSGGVASGPMTATFMLPFAVGASAALGGNVLTDAFGLVSVVAMMPLVTIQITGLIYQFKVSRMEREAVLHGDMDIIELWGESA